MVTGVEAKSMTSYLENIPLSVHFSAFLCFYCINTRNTFPLIDGLCSSYFNILCKDHSNTVMMVSVHN